MKFPANPAIIPLMVVFSICFFNAQAEVSLPQTASMETVNLENPVLKTLRPGVKKQTENKKQPNFGPYIQHLQSRIRHNWSPPQPYKKSYRVAAWFKIDKDGNLSNLKLQEPSSDRASNEAALAAVRASAPFEKLPKDFTGDDIDVQFIFDVEVGRNFATQTHRTPSVGFGAHFGRPPITPLFAP